jgi:hypothetical protein
MEHHKITLKHLIFILVLGLCATPAKSQIPDNAFLGENINDFFIVAEAGYHTLKGEISSEFKPRFGVGLVYQYPWTKRENFTIGAHYVHQGLNLTKRTTELVNSTLYYRSSQINSIQQLVIPLTYEYSISQKLALGVGYQIGFLMRTNKDVKTVGTATTVTADVDAKGSIPGFLGIIRYKPNANNQCALRYMYNPGSIAKNVDDVFSRGLSFQILRRI